MGHHFWQTAHIPVDEHIKIMEDEELLDFWEESQFMEDISRDFPALPLEDSTNYERLILQELQLRFCCPPSLGKPNPPF